jgi:stress response protein YsnF
MIDPDSEPAVLPLVEERVSVDKRTVETSRVSIRTAVEQTEVLVAEDLLQEIAAVERAPVGREVETAPEPRWEGDVLIVPVVEEFLVVEKRLRLVEELRVVRRRSVERVETKVPLRSTRVEVERRDGDDAPHPN